jgi:Holliday junction resolvase-like predicted endonuclease
VLEHGKEYGKLDKGIDLIAKKEKEVIFIQCKNWKADGKVKIDHVKIKEFIGNVATFLEKNTVYKDYEVKRIFAVAEPILDKSAIEYIKANKNIVRYLHLPMP